MPHVVVDSITRLSSERLKIANVPIPVLLWLDSRSCHSVLLTLGQ